MCHSFYIFSLRRSESLHPHDATAVDCTSFVTMLPENSHVISRVLITVVFTSIPAINSLAYTRQGR